MTPPTGIPFGGWVRADRVANGAHGRLFATAIVLERGGKRVALVSVDLFAATGGLVQEAARRAGLSEREVLVSASHTHAGPSGYANFDLFNTLAPSKNTITRPETFVELLDPRPTDRQLLAFLVRRTALAIRRALDGMGPAVAAWGSTQLTGVTRNRSLEAHLAGHGVLREPGGARPEEDPLGALHTVDPDASVLRVDRLTRRTRRCGPRLRRRCRVTIPLGGFSSFANHGTVNPSEYQVYNQDHHGAANRTFEAGVRREGRVRGNRPVVNVYGNGNEGDQSAGLDGQGPAKAAEVGRREGLAMLEAWRRARRSLSRRPALDVRWTRACFCGQQVEGGRVASSPLVGVPFLTGSEEGRGPLFEITGVPFEGARAPEEGFESQGHKVGVGGAASDVPARVPLMVVRVGERMLATIPGEPTVEVGRRVRAAVLRAAGAAGVREVVISGLANEFILYFTTPEEYDRQHYEGGSTLFGPLSSVVVQEGLADLAGRLAGGRPAPDPAPFDPTNGVPADAPPYGPGAASAAILAEPAPRVAAGTITSFRWRGGERGLDRPLDEAFVTVERREGARWRPVTDDRDLQIVWRIDGDRYAAQWGPPATAPEGEHRFVVTANRYRLVSRAFSVAR